MSDKEDQQSENDKKKSKEKDENEKDKTKDKKKEKIDETRTYDISSEDQDYSLKIEIDHKYLRFIVHEVNEVFKNAYKNKFELNQIIKKLNLVKSKYTSFSKLLHISIFINIYGYSIRKR